MISSISCVSLKRGERLPQGITDRVRLVQRVGEVDQQRFLVRPGPGLRVALDDRRLRRLPADARAVGRYMHAPFVFGAAARGRAQDHQLALAQRDAAPVEQAAGHHPHVGAPYCADIVRVAVLQSAAAANRRRSHSTGAVCRPTASSMSGQSSMSATCRATAPGSRATRRLRTEVPRSRRRPCGAGLPLH